MTDVNIIEIAEQKNTVVIIDNHLVTISAVNNQIIIEQQANEVIISAVGVQGATGDVGSSPIDGGTFF